MAFARRYISLYRNLEHDVLYIDPEEAEDKPIFEDKLDDWLTPVASREKAIKHTARRTTPSIGGSSYADSRVLEKMTIVLSDLVVGGVDAYDPPTLGNRRLLEYPDQVVDPRCSKLFYDMSDDTPEGNVPKMVVGRIAYDWMTTIN
ncbi:hypothetical protein VTL71DRAFT_15440 [Oculimacula yallundae]|uniref:Uncharacterized protein n=1 Tax=Oculimacula yallundae TaxID=86028 RepID=A0ABR4CHB8_9HELO